MVGPRVVKQTNGAFKQLYPVWKNTNILTTTKIRLFNTNVQSVLLFKCEMWKITKWISNSLQDEADLNLPGWNGLED